MIENSVSFAGSSDYKQSAVQTPFTIVKQSTSLTVGPTPAAGQYSDDTNLQATLLAGVDRPMAQRSVFFVAGALAETLSATSSVITDYAGRAPAGPINLPAGSYPVTVYFLGVIPVGGGDTVTLEDSRFLASTGVGALQQTAENAEVAYTGDMIFPSGQPLHLTAQVVQEDDGMPGDLARAQVRYLLLDSNSQVAADVTGAVDAAGNSTANAASLPPGDYLLTVQVVGGYFGSPASQPVAIQVLPPTAVTLDTLTAQASQSATVWLGALLAIAALALAALAARRRAQQPRA